MADASISSPDVILPDEGVIGGFKLGDILMSGGRTAYLRVEDSAGDIFSMKVPLRRFVDDPSLGKRFAQEAEILKLLSGPCFPEFRAVGTYTSGEYSAIPYIVTDLPRGDLLDGKMASDRTVGAEPDLEGGLRLLRNLALALKQMHERGVVHRNLRPSCVVVGPRGEVQILDFVLGRGATQSTITMAGAYLGTARYVAPEQVRDARNADGRADLYSLGLIIYEYITHEHPFGGPSSTKTEEVLKHLSDEPEPPSWINPDISPQVDNLFARLLKADPNERYPNADALIKDLDQASE